MSCDTCSWVSRMPRAFNGSGDNLQCSGPLVLSAYQSSWCVRAVLPPCHSGLCCARKLLASLPARPGLTVTRKPLGVRRKDATLMHTGAEVHKCGREARHFPQGAEAEQCTLLLGKKTAHNKIRKIETCLFGSFCNGFAARDNLEDIVDHD